jgi:Glycosyltransferase like family 2
VIVVPPPAAPVLLAGGVTAHEDADGIGPAVRSLLDSRLPPGVAWSGVWVVVSPGRDGTIDRARALARIDGRIRVIEEPTRRGKAAALVRLLGAMRGDLAVLLNGDAWAEPAAVAAMLERVPAPPAPFAVMARPVAVVDGSTPRVGAVRLLWQLHHDLHDTLLNGGEGTHLSDELLMLPLARAPPLREGIINDGAFIGGWLSRHGGRLVYAPDARVRIGLPTSLRALVEQRRRIRHGHRQAHRLTGVAPSTLDRQLLAAPRRAIGIVRRSLGTGGDGYAALATLAAVEVAAAALAWADTVRGASEPAVWARVPSDPAAGPDERGPARGDPSADRAG